MPLTLFETKELDVKHLNFQVYKLVDSELVQIDVSNGKFGISASHNGVLVGYTRGDAHGRLCLKTKPLELQIPTEHMAAQLLNSKAEIQKSSNLRYFLQTKGCKPSGLENPQTKGDASMLAEIRHYQTVAVGNMTLKEMFDVTPHAPVTKAIAQTDGQGWIIVKISSSQYESKSKLGFHQAKYIEISSDQNKETEQMRQIGDHVRRRAQDVSEILLDKFSNLKDEERDENKQLLLGLGAPAIQLDEWVPLKQHVVTAELAANGFKLLKVITNEKCEPFMADWTCLDASKKLMLGGKFLRQGLVGTLEAVNLAMTTMWEEDHQTNLPLNPRECAQALDMYISGISGVLSTQAGVERLWHHTANASSFQAGSKAVYTSDGNVKFRMKVDTSSHNHPTFKMVASVTNDGEQQTILPRNNMLIDENQTEVDLGDCEDLAKDGANPGQMIESMQASDEFRLNAINELKLVCKNQDMKYFVPVYEKTLSTLSKCDFVLRQTIGMANGAEVMTQNEIQTSGVISNALQHWNGLKNPMQTGQKCGHSFVAMHSQHSQNPHSRHIVGEREYTTTSFNIKDISFGECTAPTSFAENRNKMNQLKTASQFQANAGFSQSQTSHNNLLAVKDEAKYGTDTVASSEDCWVTLRDIGSTPPYDQKITPVCDKPMLLTQACSVVNGIKAQAQREHNKLFFGDKQPYVMPVQVANSDAALLGGSGFLSDLFCSGNDCWVSVGEISPGSGRIGVFPAISIGSLNYDAVKVSCFTSSDERHLIEEVTKDYASIFDSNSGDPLMPYQMQALGDRVPYHESTMVNLKFPSMSEAKLSDYMKQTDLKSVRKIASGVHVFTACANMQK